MIGTRLGGCVARALGGRRSFSTNPFQPGSVAYSKFESCLDKATEAGVDLFAEYSPWLPVDLMQNTILAMEAVLPFGGWPVAIAATAVLSRAMLFPMQLWSMRKSRSSQTVMQDMTLINKQLKRASSKGDTKTATRLQEKYNALVAEHGRFFAFKGIVGSLLPIPLFMTSFATLRGLAEHPTTFPAFALADPLWLDSLALPDPYFALPVLSAGLFLTNLELTGRLDSAAGSSVADVRKGVLGEMGEKYGNVLTDEFMAKIKKYGLRGVVVSSLYFTSGFPAACFFFFIPNTLLAITQNRLLRRETVQVWLGLQQQPSLAASAVQTAAQAPLQLEAFVKLRKAERKLLRPSAAGTATGDALLAKPRRSVKSARQTGGQAASVRLDARLDARREPQTVKAILKQQQCVIRG